MQQGIRWIDSAGELRDYAASLPDGPLGLDTEADSFHRYRERLCLLQVCAGEQVALIDPLALEDLGALRPVLEDPARRKVVHGGDYDVRLLWRDHGIAPAGLFDTMIAARLCGMREFGLAALVERLAGATLDKSHQRADWARRPLPERMMVYAAEDVRHLVALADTLERELARLGRTEWAEEDFRRLESARWTEDSEDPERWRRVKGASGLDRRALAVLRAAWHWRENRARRLDRPPFRVVREELLAEVARDGCPSRDELARRKGAPRAWLEGRGGIVELWDALESARRLREEDLPAVVVARKPHRDPAFEERVRRLKAHRDRVASGLGIEPSVLASRATLEALQRWLDGSGAPMDLRDWQRAALGSLERFRPRL